jgi:mono/diheme cytochrome c family protein
MASGLNSLKTLPLTLRVVISLALLTIGVGYLVAMLNLYLTYSLTDGATGLGPSDLKRAFYGNRDNTKLAAKIHGGSMEQFLTRRGDKEKILSWIQDGAEQRGYEEVVRPILTQNCVRCHNPNGLQRFAPLTSYEEVMIVTQVDRGEPVSLWARVAHTHLQSIGLIFLFLGTVFSFTSLEERWKVAIVVLPFAALLLDFGTRFLARYVAGIVYLMMAAGALLGLSFAVMILYPLYDLWLKK